MYYNDLSLQFQPERRTYPYAAGPYPGKCALEHPHLLSAVLLSLFSAGPLRPGGLILHWPVHRCRGHYGRSRRQPGHPHVHGHDRRLCHGLHRPYRTGRRGTQRRRHPGCHREFDYAVRLLSPRVYCPSAGPDPPARVPPADSGGVRPFGGHLPHHLLCRHPVHCGVQRHCGRVPRARGLEEPHVVRGHCLHRLVDCCLLQP